MSFPAQSDVISKLPPACRDSESAGAWLRTAPGMMMAEREEEAARRRVAVPENEMSGAAAQSGVAHANQALLPTPGKSPFLKLCPVPGAADL